MIRKLQKHFILMSMSAFFLVLTIIIGSINIVNYNTMKKEADRTLSILSENNGFFPLDEEENDKPDRREPLLEGKPKSLPPHMSPELPYESRHFTVVFEKDKQSAVRIDTKHIASVSQEKAVEYAKSCLSQNSSNGFIEQYRYLKKQTQTTIQITFLDCGRKIDSFQSFLLSSILISGLGYLIVFFLIAFFSERIIRPISESYEKQKRFVTDAGHEIKTPLTIIYADADVLEMETGENEWTKDIKQQARRLTDLTNNLVCLARMEEPEASLPMIDFPVSDLVEETALSFQTLAQSRNKTLLFEIEPMLSLCGNEESIRQLVGILLENALKYSPESSSIFLKLKKQHKTMQLTVSNETGSPIKSDHLPLLFDRFYRTDPSRNSETGGHGIGLSIAKAIATAHGGSIHAATKDGNSITFTVSFPL